MPVPGGAHLRDLFAPAVEGESGFFDELLQAAEALREPLWPALDNGEVVRHLMAVAGGPFAETDGITQGVAAGALEPIIASEYDGDLLLRSRTRR